MKLPEDRRRRMALCLALIVLAPLVTATLTVCILDAVFRFDLVAVTEAAVVLPYLVGAVLGAVGASAAALALPIRYWSRITAAVVCLIGVFFGFPVFCVVANEALYAAFGVGLGPIPD